MIPHQVLTFSPYLKLAIGCSFAFHRNTEDTLFKPALPAVRIHYLTRKKKSHLEKALGKKTSILGA